MLLFKKKDKNNRKDYSKIISGMCFLENQDLNFIEFCSLVIKQLSTHFNIEQGIALNRVLLENIFSTFVCILTKIPIFLCGKPGCSKSLSVNIVLNALIGNRSKDKVFKYLPSVIKTNYQGSNTCTSEGVKKVFDRTREKIQRELENNNNQLKNIYLIYFDEMGLAEISPNNPLKVIHSELEYENNLDKKKIAFVGVSNWTLDASKMNRGIYLSVSELDEEDLKETMKAISESYNTGSINLYEKYKDLFDALCSTYLNYIGWCKNDKLYKDFHGTRDFYSLIKICSKQLILKEEKKINLSIKEIAIESIERNFGGFDLSIKKFKEFFSINYSSCENKKNYPVQKCIELNIQNEDNRYLLVISKSSISKYLINYILTRMKKKNVFLSGSKFELDLINEKYSLSLLNKIEILMKFGNVIVLDNLESIYPSLYDLFNQSFQIVAGKKYSKISLGNLNDVKFEVNKDLRFIILLDPEDIFKQDPPFLNRFEKHIISFDYILEPKENELATNIFNKLKSLSEPKNIDKKQLEVNLSKQLINFDLEEIKGLIYKYKLERKEEKELTFIECLEYILEIIVPTFSQDLIVFIKHSVFYFNYENFYNEIINNYSKGNHDNLNEFIKNMTSQKNVIFTFSSVIDKIFLNDEIIQNKDLTFSLKKTYKKIIDENDNEKIIDSILKSYMKSTNNLLIFQISFENLKHLNHIQFLLDNFILENEISLKNKYFIIIIHLKRILPNLNVTSRYLSSYSNLISHLSNYNQIFIDNLKGKHENITSILELSNKELFGRKDLYNIEQEFDKTVYPAFLTICYEILNQTNEINQNNYREKASKALIDNKQLKKYIQEKIIDEIDKNEKSILMSVFIDKNFVYNDISFYSILSRFMKYLQKFYLIKFIIQTEKDFMLPFLLFKSDEDLNEVQKELKIKYLEQLNFSDLKNVKDEMNENKVTSILNLGIPLYKNKLDYFHNNLDLYKIEYLDTINRIRTFEDEEEFENNNEEIALKIKREKINQCIEMFNNKIGNITGRMKNDFIDIKLFENIKIDFNNTELIKMLIQDYYIIFLSKKFMKSDIHKFLPFLEFIVNEGMKKIYPNYQQENINTMNNYMKIILFIQYFNEYITILIQILYDLDSIVEFDILNKIQNYIQTSADKENKELSLNQRILNNIKIAEPFTSISNGLCNIITENIDTIQGEKSKKFYEIGNKIGLNVSKMKYSLGIKCTLVLIMNIILKIYEIVSFTEQDIETQLKKYSLILKEENNYISLNKKREAEEYLEKEFNFLKELLKSQIKLSKEEQYKTCIFFLCNKYRTYDILSDKIFQIILDDTNKELIAYSKTLFSLFFIDQVDGLEPEDNIEQEDLFLKFIDNQDAILILDIINEKCIENDNIAEILISIFETRINPFFEEIKKNSIEKIGGSCKDYLNKCLLIIEPEKDEEPPKLQNIGTIYSITYIKCFLNFYIELLLNNKGIEGILNGNKYITTILFRKDNHFSNTLKIYIMKLIYKFYNKDYNSYLQECNSEKFKDYIINFPSEEKKEQILQYSFFPIHSLGSYEKISNLILGNENDLKDSVKNNNKEFHFIIDRFINSYLSQLKHQKEGNFQVLSILQNLFEDENIINETEKKFYKLFIGDKTLNSQIFDKMNNEQFLIFLTCFKLISLFIHNHEESFYKYIIESNNVLDYLKKLYIIGGVPTQSLKIKSYITVEEKLKREKNPFLGQYICECGFNYEISGCGYPAIISKCGNCQKNIGGREHNLVKETDFRVFLDESERNASWDRYNFGRRIKNKLLSEYKEDIIKLLNIDEKGLIKTSEIFEKMNEKKIRDLDDLSFNILNFIFLSSLFFNFLVNKKDLNNELKDYFPDSKSILEYIYYKYERISNYLSIKKIKLEVFLNLLYENLIILNDKPVKCSSEQERREFEKEFNNIINKTIEESRDEQNEKKYLEKNNQIVNLDKMQLILNELESPYSYINEYEKLNFFIIPTFSSLEDLNKQFNNLNEEEKIKYPILKAFFDFYQNKILIKMKKLLDINPFENELLNYYSYTNPITREEAIEKKIKNELKSIQNKYPNKNIKENFNSFKTAWNEIYTLITQYNCQSITPIKIDEDKSLSFILADNVENYGLQISGMYYEFLTVHNLFVSTIIENIKLNKDSKFSFFIDQLEKKILIQNVTENEIFDFSKIKAEYFLDFEEIINENSFRNIPSSKDNKVNYMKNKEIIYNFEYIEELLGQGLLFGKKKFSDELTFIIYDGEIFNKNSSILIQFIQKYEQDKNGINDSLKMALFKLQNSEGFNYKEVSFSILVLIFYLLQKEKKNVLISDSKLIDENDDIIINNETSLKKVVENKPDFISVNDNLKELFQSHEFKVKHLMDVFEYIELWNYNEIIKNVDNKYKDIIDEETKTKIDEFFKDDVVLDNKTINSSISNQSINISEKLITKNELAKATRKFISRHLSLKKKNEEIPPDSDLFKNLERDDLWKKDFMNSTEFDRDMDEIQSKFQINVGQALKFYEYIGEKKELLKEGIEQFIGDSDNKKKNNTKEPKSSRNKKRSVK